MLKLKRQLKKTFSLGLVCTAVLSTASVSAIQNENVKVYVSKPKLSQPLSKIAKPLPKLTPALRQKSLEFGKEKSDYIVPNRNFPHIKEYLENIDPTKIDPLIQGNSAASSAINKNTTQSVNLPNILLGFDGIGEQQGSPADTNADVGPNHIVQTVNVAMAVWDKQGNLLQAPANINKLWKGFGG